MAVCARLLQTCPQPTGALTRRSAAPSPRWEAHERGRLGGGCLNRPRYRLVAEEAGPRALVDLRVTTSNPFQDRPRVLDLFAGVMLQYRLLRFFLDHVRSGRAAFCSASPGPVSTRATNHDAVCAVAAPCGSPLRRHT
jgi:hypothetical protein